MKKITLSYLIYLSFYINELACLSTSKFSQNATTIESNNSMQINDYSNRSSNNKNNAERIFATTAIKINTYNQQNDEKQKQIKYSQTIPITIAQNTSKNLKYTTEKLLISSTTSQYQQQYIELPTYRQHTVEMINNLTAKFKYDGLNRVSINDDNEIDQTIDNILDVGSNGNEKLEYGMKTTKPTLKISPKTTKYNFNLAKDASMESEKTKKRQTAKMKTSKTQIPTKPSYLLKQSEINNDRKKYIATTSNKQNSMSSEKIVTKVGATRIQLQSSNFNVSYDALTCPKETEAQFNLFAINCKTDNDCIDWNREFRCCTIFGSTNCHKGVTKPLKEPVHSPILGIIPRKCPERPLAEFFWNLKICETDEDCWPRVCCPDGRNKYCRTSTPEYKLFPFQFGRSLEYVSEYLECTPPPPPIFDLHPKPCSSTLDCFPNICCQEAGKKNCRPPKKSVLSFMANFLNTGIVRRLTNNLMIKR